MLELDHISKTFNPGTVNEKRALHELTLRVKNGDFISIIGANGAGKSTLFNAIAGSFLLFQDPMRGTAPGMTIEENLALAAGRGGWLGRITKADRALFRDKLAPLGMGLEDRMQHPVGLLSGGQRQALSLMMATINTPKLLLLDEHTAALDPATAEKVLNLTKQIVKDDKLTCLMITHNMQSALELGNRTLMMDGGHIIFDVEGEARTKLTVPDLLVLFREAAGCNLDNDRMMLS